MGDGGGCEVWRSRKVGGQRVRRGGTQLQAYRVGQRGGGEVSSAVRVRRCVVRRQWSSVGVCDGHRLSVSAGGAVQGGRQRGCPQPGVPAVQDEASDGQYPLVCLHI